MWASSKQVRLTEMSKLTACMSVLETFLLRCCLLDVGCYNLLLSVVEFTQGMILPTANGVTKQQTAQATTKTSKTQVSLKVSRFSSKFDV